MRTPNGPKKGPPALRPGDTDDVLESDRLDKIIRWGFITVVFFAAFFPVYWFLEPGRMAAREGEFKETSMQRGEEYFAMRADPETGEENFNGVECARCHGTEGVGGTNEFLNPKTGQRTTVKVPELQMVFSRFQPRLESTPFKEVKDMVKDVIEKGRPGTDMPTWATEFGGPLTDQQIDDIVNYLESIQKEAPEKLEGDGPTLYGQVCATCHGQNGEGGSGPPFTGGSEAAQFPNIEDQIKFVIEGSQAGQPFGKSGQGTGGMPPRGGNPGLTDEQIKAIVEYERSL